METKVTLELPADLVRQLKVLAASEDRRLKDVAAATLRRGLAARGDDDRSALVQLPLVLTAHRAQPGQEMTPERVAQVLGDGE